MGLDITAYGNLTPCDVPEVDEDGYPLDEDKYFYPGEPMMWSEKAFPGRGEGIDPKGYYLISEQLEFGAGSYSYYNAWRSELAKFAGIKQPGRTQVLSIVKELWVALFGDNASKPFFELVWFADNEGVIGPVVSTKLAKDFRDNLDHVRSEYEKNDETGFLELYEEWMKAFELASNDGCVVFH